MSEQRNVQVCVKVKLKIYWGEVPLQHEHYRTTYANYINILKPSSTWNRRTRKYLIMKMEFITCRWNETCRCIL